MVYKSNRPECAYESGNGIIVVSKAGTAKLTTKINGKTVTITVNVK